MFICVIWSVAWCNWHQHKETVLVYLGVPLSQYSIVYTVCSTINSQHSTEGTQLVWTRCHLGMQNTHTSAYQLKPLLSQVSLSVFSFRLPPHVGKVRHCYQNYLDPKRPLDCNLIWIMLLGWCHNSDGHFICVGGFVIGGGLPEQRTPWAIRPHMKFAQYSHQCGPLNVCTYTKGKAVIVSQTHIENTHTYILGQWIIHL